MSGSLSAQLNNAHMMRLFIIFEFTGEMVARRTLDNQRTYGMWHANVVSICSEKRKQQRRFALCTLYGIEIY